MCVQGLARLAELAILGNGEHVLLEIQRRGAARDVQVFHLSFQETRAFQLLPVQPPEHRAMGLPLPGAPGLQPDRRLQLQPPPPAAARQVDPLHKLHRSTWVVLPALHRTRRHHLAAGQVPVERCGLKAQVVGLGRPVQHNHLVMEGKVRAGKIKLGPSSVGLHVPTGHHQVDGHGHAALASIPAQPLTRHHRGRFLEMHKFHRSVQLHQPVVAQQ